MKNIYDNILGSRNHDYTPNVIVNSPIKWAGGKRKSLPYIHRFLNAQTMKNKGCYYEPFCGSCSVALSLNFPKMVLNDKNKKLINFFIQLQKNPHRLFNKITKLSNQYNDLNVKDKEFFYYKIRDEYNGKNLCKGNGIKYATYFWFLNKTGFNGIYRESKNGHFNIPFGKRECPLPTWKHFESANNRFKNTIFLSHNYVKLCKDIKENDIVYFDPPYLPESIEDNNFTSYIRYGFSVNEHIKLKNIIRSLSKKGTRIVLSNSNSKLTHGIYGDLEGFNMEVISISRTISGLSKGRSNVSEMIIHNIDHGN